MKRRIPHIHERFLRHIWNRQYLHGTTLTTTTGASITVLHPGKLNSDAGPDFLDAKIKIGRTTYVGDVEIHRNATEWLQHQHQEDPRYNRVVLHVVLEGNLDYPPTLSQSGRAIPVLVLEQFLSESIRAVWQRSILDERVRTAQTIKCSSLNSDISAEVISIWLQKLSVERLELKLRRFEERLRQLAQEETMLLREPSRRYGLVPIEGYPEEIPPPSLEPTMADFSKKHLWEQTLYEGIMDALGFSKNRDPFVRLAQSVTLQRIREFGAAEDRLQLEALLFGVAGLLPKTFGKQDRETKAYSKELLVRWKKIRPHFRGATLHRADWVFFPTRPLNFPPIRLAVGAGLIENILQKDLFRKMIQSFKHAESPEALDEMLVGHFSVEPSEFWKRHYTFDQSARKPIRSLGEARIRDIIVNTLLPIVLLYARMFREQTVRECALELYDWFPPLSDNVITRTMEKQLLKGKVSVKSVGAQQGLIQLYKYYCTESRCDECDVGKIVFSAGA